MSLVMMKLAMSITTLLITTALVDALPTSKDPPLT
jgi:hypothetical protein